MTWLLVEILAFVAAAAAFGVLIGLGLAAAGANRKAVGYQRAHQGLIDRIQALEQSQRVVEVRAEARSAAEAAVRADLEGRLTEAEVAAAEYRARAEAAERQTRVLARPDYSSPVRVEPPATVRAPEDLAEIERLKAALAAAHSRAEAVTRAATAVTHAGVGSQQPPHPQATPQTAPIWDPPLPKGTGHGVANGNATGETTTAGEPANDTNGSPTSALDERDRPPGLAAPRGGRADDLRRIRGIGPRNEGVLNALGLFHYEQIATLSDRHVNWLDAYFRFPGRIGRENWVGQAKALVAQRGRAEPSDKVHPEDAGF